MSSDKSPPEPMWLMLKAINFKSVPVPLAVTPLLPNTAAEPIQRSSAPNWCRSTKLIRFAVAGFEPVE